jgi:hypothetical protein
MIFGLYTILRDNVDDRVLLGAEPLWVKERKVLDGVGWELVGGMRAVRRMMRENVRG